MHPSFLRKESTELSNDSNYKEKYQSRDNLFISHGNIVVRLNEIHRFPILIIYTDATPYQLPLIYPLQKELSRIGVNELSTLTLNEAVDRIKPVIQFYYNLRHQNSSGALCILEFENLETGNSFFGISTILKRVRDWFAGHVTNQYPPDTEEVDFCAHFNFIDQEIKLFYPESFLSDEFVEGDCYATIYNFIPPGRYFLHPRYIYSGTFLDGLGPNGLFDPTNNYILPPILHEKLKTSNDIYNNPSIVKQLIDEKKILKAHWFHIENEPKPFCVFKNLVEIIGNGDYNNGIKRITARCLDSLKLLPQSFFLGLRFQNRKHFNEFQLFKIYEVASPTTYLFYENAEDTMRCILERYEKVEAIDCEKLTKATFHQRNSKRADYEILSKAYVNIFGVGAIGSEVADCLAKAGTGSLILFDDQIFKAHNAVRHLAGLGHIGEPKVNAVAEILYNHNPFIFIWPVRMNLFNLNIGQHIADDSISISSLADDNVEGFVNQQLVIANRVAFYVRALRGGKAARLFRVIPGKDACFNCLSLYRKEKKEFIEIPDDPDYPTLKNECNNPIRPASASDLKFIASLASRILIDYLQNDETDINHWIWSSEVLSDTSIKEPYQIYSQHISPHPNCSYCYHDYKIKVSISTDKVAFIKELIKQNPKNETGGVLAGWTDERGNTHITDVSGPGPNASQMTSKFEKDIVYCQHFLDELYIQSKQKKVYVGEWHSHPSSNNNPSGIDIKSLSEIAFQKEYLTDIPIMIIFSNTGDPSCSVHPAGKRYYFTNLESY